MSLGLQNPRIFLTDRSGLYKCIVCPGQDFQSLSRARKHEDTRGHTQIVRELDGTPSPPKRKRSKVETDEYQPAGSRDVITALTGVVPGSPITPKRPKHRESSPIDTSQFDALFEDDWDDPIPTSVHGPALPDDPDDQIYDNFSGALAAEEYDSDDEDVLLSELQNDLKSDGPLDGTSELPLPSEGDDVTDICGGPASSNQGEWWPWKNKEEALLDIMSAFPRSMFSEKELEVTRWFAHKLGVFNLPSVKQVKDHRKNVLEVAGLCSTTMESQMHNLYTHNDIRRIIEHEFANPLVRKHLHTYPEDGGNMLSEARHAERWRSEVDADLAAPMARSSSGKDYFVHEPSLVELHDGEHGIVPVIPTRWFQRGQTIWAKAHLLISDGNGFFIDGTHCLDIPLTSFFLNVIDLEKEFCQQTYSLPPLTIRGIFGTSANDINLVLPWPYQPRNPWRQKAAGKRVFSVPIWLYCDDTSGNTSKKWNKHNSILFILAGLPQDRLHMLYNIHFVATSNIASPLEMMECVRDALRDIRENGIKLWDCEYDEEVLVLLWVLAFEGDNPMSSEFACHIGMSGTHFCRVCHARGMDSIQRAQGDDGMAEWLRSFLKAGSLRDRRETIDALHSQLARAVGGAPSGIAEMATKTGVKDKYMLYFVSVMQEAAVKFRDQNAGVRGQQEQLKRHLTELRDAMPNNLFSPVLAIPDFDPNRDSPVEILHVVLLGVVKYWWRDAVSRLNSSQKDELKTRLSSLEVFGLNTARLRGNTFVQYAGSLVGRDFRIILQVAPSILQGLVPDVHYQAWLTLCRLAPMIFQPVINDLKTYLGELEDAIWQFLAATALWNIQWFNKAKFHLFVHLPYHIRRFGPLCLYATETCESFNFVIRLRSIHSSKQAPSVDIANAFSHAHAVRHLVSGGYVDQDEKGSPIKRRQAGQGVLTLVEDKEFLEFMSLTGLYKDVDIGRYSPEFHNALSPWKHTLGFKFCQISVHLDPEDILLLCRSLVLRNGDIMQLRSYIIYKPREGNISAVGRVEEILVLRHLNRLLGVVVTECDVSRVPCEPYYLPQCTYKTDSAGRHQYAMIPFQNLICIMNTFHNCAKNACKVTQTSSIVQERVQTQYFKNEITHQNNPGDRLINTAQLRSSEAIRVFAVPRKYPDLDIEDLIKRAIERKRAIEIQAQKVKEGKEARAAAKGKKAAGKRLKEMGRQPTGSQEGTAVHEFEGVLQSVDQSGEPSSSAETQTVTI